MASAVSKVSHILRYDWQETASAITRADFHLQPKIQPVAYLQARDENTDLSALKAACEAKGWNATPEVTQKGHQLRVLGFNAPEEMIDVLNGQGISAENAQINTIPLKDGPKKSFFSSTIGASSIFYLIGDVLATISGRKRGNDWAQMATGIAFMAGDLGFVAFSGKEKIDPVVPVISALKEHLQEKGVVIPEGTGITAERLAAKGGLLETTHDFMTKNINSIKVLAEVLGGAFYYKAGVKQENARKKAAGAVIVGGWAAALLLQEKKTDPATLKDAGPLVKLAAKIQDKPLSLAGTAGLVHNGLSLWGAIEERNKEMAKKSNGQTATDHYKYDMGMIASMVIANGLFAMSKKGHGAGAEISETQLQDVIALSTEIIQALPERQRDSALLESAKIISLQDSISLSQEEILTRLREHTTAVKEHSPFVQRVTQPNQQDFTLAR